MSDKIMLNFRCPSSVLEAIDSLGKERIVECLSLPANQIGIVQNPDSGLRTATASLSLLCYSLPFP
jgi:hypothetical protein